MAQEKIVILLADCWDGAMDAGHFIAGALFDSRTRIILLHTYQQPVNGVAELHHLSPLLQKTAAEDVANLKVRLIQDIGLPDEAIHTDVFEGDLRSVLSNYYDQYQHVSIVLGTQTRDPYWNNSYRKIMQGLLGSKVRPIFLIDGFITVIENGSIAVVAEKEANISSLFLSFLIDFYGKENSRLELITVDNKNFVGMEENTIHHFSKTPAVEGFKRSPVEKIFFEWVININT